MPPKRVIGTDRTRFQLKEVLESAGISYARASREIGKNPAYVQQYIERGSPKKMHEDDRRKLADLAGCDERLLVPRQTPLIESFASEVMRKQPVHRRADMHDLPLWLASTAGELVDVDLSTPPAYVLRLEQFNANSLAWACRVMDDGLKPCLQIGDTAFFDPLDPARPGDLVCLVRVLTDKHAVERRLGICEDLSRTSIWLSSSVIDKRVDTIALKPHVRVGRMVGMLRR